MRAVLCCLLATSALAAAKPPHIVFLLADDLGWADVGWHRPPGWPEVSTPNLDALVQSGVELERHYVHKYCSPTRSSVQSGRMPIHVNVMNYLPTMVNDADPVAGFSAIPRNMTGIAARLKEANYTTVMAGKWDAGMATRDHTPQGRGYDHSLFYFHHDNDYWNSRAGPACTVPNYTGHDWHAYTKPRAPAPAEQWVVRDGYLAAGNDAAPKRATTVATAQAACADMPACNGFTFEDYDRLPTHNVTISFKTNKSNFVADTGVLPQDLWMDGAPAHLAANNASVCQGSPWVANGTAGQCAYEDQVFSDFILRHLREHDAAAAPIFIFWAFHIAHSPYQVPEAYANKFAFINNSARQIYHAMVHFMDDKVGELVSLLHAKAMYNDTLIVFSSDNGGPITQAANNYPLRGGKHSNFDGGVRANAFASGGLLPEPVRGTKLDALAGIWDWYGTFCSLAGIDQEDHRAAAAKLPPVDSVDLWPVLSGAVAPSAGPRREVALGTCANAVHGDVFCQGSNPGPTDVNGVIAVDDATGGLFKLIRGVVPEAVWTGPLAPNGTNPGSGRSIDCGEQGCLFRLDTDPTEHVDLNADNATRSQYAQLVTRLSARIEAHRKTVFSPDRGTVDPRACDAALHNYGRFWGPWIE